MSKIYFEMNDKERQLKHIGENIDYAICMFSEGLSGTGEYSIPSEEVKELHNQITDNLLKAYDDINILLKAVEEKEEVGQTLIFNSIGGATEINDIKDCEVYHVREAEGINGTEIVFHNTRSGMYRNLLIDDDGELSMSQWY